MTDSAAGLTPEVNAAIIQRMQRTAYWLRLSSIVIMLPFVVKLILSSKFPQTSNPLLPMRWWDAALLITRATAAVYCFRYAQALRQISRIDQAALLEAVAKLHLTGWRWLVISLILSLLIPMGLTVYSWFY
jgi:hypothetical protein